MADGTDLVVHEEEARGNAIQLLLALETEGQLDEVSLTITDPDLPYSTWVGLGKFLGSLDRRCRWYLGDWLNFGEAVYGESEAAQAVEMTPAERYDEALRVSGLDKQTLMNISSICRRIARGRRRKELGFWIHAEVAALDNAEQVKWLQRAIDEGWHRAELRDAIRAEKNPAPDGDEDDDEGSRGNGGAGDGLTVAQRIEVAARAVWQNAQSTSDGSFLIPPEPMSRLRAALGEE